MQKNNVFMLIGSLLILTSCASIGPKQIDIDREAYNDIVRETDYEQVLKNIVRLSYAEPTSYLKITSVTASYQFTRNIAATISGQQANTNNNTIAPNTSTGFLGVTPSLNYSDAPTISYVPIDDAAFVTALQQPVNFEDIALLVNGGISSTELIMRLVIDWLGELDNASSAANAKVTEIPEYAKYNQFMDILLNMTRTKSAYIDPVSFNNKAGIIIDFTHEHENSVEANKLKQLVGVPLSSKDIIMVNQNIINLKLDPHKELLEEDSGSIAKNMVFVQMRSLNAMMAFLSHSVQIPDADIKAGIAPQLKTANGQVYDWQPLMKDLMAIASSDKEPFDAFVKTKVNGHWFYIKKSDINSKMTFTLLIRLMVLKAGLGQNKGQLSPVITVPVGATRLQ